MTTIVKTSKCNEKAVKAMESLDIPFSTFVNDYVTRTFASLTGIDNEIAEHQKMLDKLKLHRANMVKDIMKMGNSERNYLLETEKALKQNKKYLKPRLAAMFKLFGRVINDGKELVEYIEYAKKLK